MTRPQCLSCGSGTWVSVSLDGGYTRRAQCVPCGAYHPGQIGPGWRSSRYVDPQAVHPDYRHHVDEHADDDGGDEFYVSRVVNGQRQQFRLWPEWVQRDGNTITIHLPHEWQETFE